MTDLSNIYKNKETGDKLFRMTKPVGHLKSHAMSHYAEWEPVKFNGRRLEPTGQKFVLDTYRFYPVVPEDVEKIVDAGIDYKASFEKQLHINRTLLMTNVIFFIMIFVVGYLVRCS